MDFSHITTKDDLISAFSRVGVYSGMNVMVHASVRKLGYVVNGPCDVIDALLDIIGESGTLLMPAHSGQLTDPADWRNPAVSSEYFETVRRYMRAFDPFTTPVRNRGVTAQAFLSYPGVRRSIHPLNSVSAKGSKANFFTEEHDFHAPEGLKSPIGKLYQLEGHVLLINVTLTSCTSIHLAEHIADVPYLKEASVKVLVQDGDGNNSFVQMERYPRSSPCFDKLLPDLRTRGLINEMAFRAGCLILFPLKPVVDYAVECLKRNANYLIEP